MEMLFILNSIYHDVADHTLNFHFYFSILLYDKIELGISNEKELGTFLQIRNLDDKQYFITKAKGDSDYTLTIINENIKRFFSSLKSAKDFAEKHYTELYLNKN
jgi:hypothetical protein